MASVKKFIRVDGVLPDANSFKIKVSSVVGKNNTCIFVAEGEEKDILSFAVVYSEKVTVLEKADADSLLASFNLPATEKCPYCGTTVAVKPVDLSKAVGVAEI